MKNKSIFISRLIYAILMTFILIALLFKNNNIIFKIVFIPFIICGISIVLQNISLILEKEKFANFFKKLYICGFLLFWFGFLFFVSYYSIKKELYLYLLFSIPFWIAGISIVRKSLFGINKKSIPKNKKLNFNFNFKIIISVFLISIVLIIGITLLVIGIKDTYRLSKISKDYLTTNGYFNDYEIYNRDRDGVTYKLSYVYEVKGKKYNVSTNYGTGSIPEKNSVRKVKYNPDNPKEAILVGTNSSNFLIFFGGFFTLGGLAFVLGALHIRGAFDRFKIDVIGTYLGLAFLIIGIGIILVQYGTASSFIETIKSLGFWIIIPLLFVIIGGIQTVKCLFVKR